MRILSIIVISILVFIFILSANDQKTITYTDSWGRQGFNVEIQNDSYIEVNFSIKTFQISDILLDEKFVKTLQLPDVILPNNEGAPDLPGVSRYIAVPKGADVSLEIIDTRTDIINDIDIAPAPRIPLNSETGPLEYKRDNSIYSKNLFYPEKPVLLSDITQIRGIDVTILGITPFQYNPVTHELIIYRDIKVKVNYIGGNGYFGDDRLRSRWWDPMFSDLLLNFQSLPKLNYNQKIVSGTKTVQDVEYLIICPDEPVILAWADSIKRFRTEQGISTGIATLTDVGGNDAGLIESYIDNAYNTWTIPPVAVLLLGDYGTDNQSILSPVYDGYCISDNLYADVNNNTLPDIVIARITAQNATHLMNTVGKFINYEKHPPTNLDYYQHPLVSGGWQDDRWFILCTEIIYGFWTNILGKQPVRQYVGPINPPTSWSTNSNTFMILSCFGPSGLGYVPATPTYLTTWNGSATGINTAIINGAFMVQHRDHGSELGWAHPSYFTFDLLNLTNNDPTYVFSTNCLTGKFNFASSCFAEVFHRYPDRALGINAATESSYSFVNDTYVWGMYDNMWPNFLPNTTTTPLARGILPAFASVAGKYYLEISSWPYNQINKEVTYYLFHHHGDAFLTVYTEFPQSLCVSHISAIFGGQSTFTVTADLDALICLTLNGDILGTATGTGGPVDVIIPPQVPGSNVIITITKQNYYRYSQNIPVIAATGPYLYVLNPVVDDNASNNNGIAECGETVDLNLNVTNLGVDVASNITGTITCTDPMLSIINGTTSISSVAISDTIVAGSFTVQIDTTTPHLHRCSIDLNMTADSAGVPNGYSWNQTIQLEIREGSKISLGKQSLNYPNTCLTYTANAQMPINNIGPDTLIITDIFSDLPQFTSNLTSLVIPPGVIKDIEISFIPDTTLTFNGTIIILNNDPVNFVHTFPVEGTGIHAAVISMVDSIWQAVNSTDSVVVPVTISNNGLGELQFNAQISGFDPNNTSQLEDGGSDNYGHMWIDSDMPNGPEFDWIDITNTGTVLPLTGCNAITDTLDLGFTFNFYGRDFDNVRACTNGWVSFSSISVAYNNFTLPSLLAPRSLIAPLWDNLNFLSDSKVYYENLGNKTVILYENVYTVYGKGPYTFQVILYNNENIVLQYLSLDSLANEYTVGIQNYEGDDGITIAHNEPYLHDSLAVMISRAIWVSVAPMSGTVAPGGSEDLYLTFLTSEFPNGDFLASLHINSNDPANGHLNVPIKMTVGVTGMEDENLYTIEGFHLYQNKPNPFNPTTTIIYYLPKASDVELVIYNMLGQKVKTLVNTHQKAKLHSVVWDGTDEHGTLVASGIYVYRIHAAENTAVNKMIFMK